MNTKWIFIKANSFTLKECSFLAIIKYSLII
jgi:hypothetical protein